MNGGVIMSHYEFKLYQMLLSQGKVNMAREIINNFWKKH